LTRCCRMMAGRDSQHETWNTHTSAPPRNGRRLRSANAFYCTFAKQQEYKKSQSTDIVFVCFGRSICKCHLTTAANSPSDDHGEERGGGGGVLQSNFYKARLSAGTPDRLAAEEPKGNILSGLDGCRSPAGRALWGGGGRGFLFQERESARFGFSDQQTHFVLHIFCCFCHDNKRVQQQLMLFSKKVYILTPTKKKVGTFKKT